MCRIFCCVIEEEGLQLHFDICGLGCFYCLGLGCLLIEEKKGSEKVNLLLPVLVSILDMLVLGCFCTLGLGLLAD